MLAVLDFSIAGRVFHQISTFCSPATVVLYRLILLLVPVNSNHAVTAPVVIDMMAAHTIRPNVASSTPAKLPATMIL